MDTRAVVVIFGTLAIFIAMIVAGFVIHTSLLAIILRIVGIVGCVAWVIFAFWLANAMNTDI
jgi:hypothetical protein